MMPALISQIKQFVVIPTLGQLGSQFGSLAAVNLVTAVGNNESQYKAIRQVLNVGYGIARGFWQMEPATHEDCWINYLDFNPALAAKLRMIAGTASAIPDPDIMMRNMAYACAMARIRLYRASAPLPRWDDARGITVYWKNNYNTSAGAGAVGPGSIALSQQAINA